MSRFALVTAAVLMLTALHTGTKAWAGMFTRNLPTADQTIANAPVKILKFGSQVPKQDYGGKMRWWKGVIDFQNATLKPIAGVEFEIIAYDVFDREMARYSLINGDEQKPGQETSKKWETTAEHSALIQRATIQVKTVKFADGTMWGTTPAQPAPVGALPTPALPENNVITQEHKRLLDIYNKNGLTALLAELGKTESTAPPPLTALLAPEAGWRKVDGWSGSGTTSTPTFAVGSEWRIRWASAPQQSQANTLQILVYRPGKDLPEDTAGNASDGASYVHRSGTFYLKIDAPFTQWNVIVEERIPAGL